MFLLYKVKKTWSRFLIFLIFVALQALVRNIFFFWIGHITYLKLYLAWLRLVAQSMSVLFIRLLFRTMQLKLSIFVYIASCFCSNNEFQKLGTN